MKDVLAHSRWITVWSLKAHFPTQAFLQFPTFVLWVCTDESRAKYWVYRHSEGGAWANQHSYTVTLPQADSQRNHGPVYAGIVWCQNLSSVLLESRSLEFLKLWDAKVFMKQLHFTAFCFLLLDFHACNVQLYIYWSYRYSFKFSGKRAPKPKCESPYLICNILRAVSTN